LMTSCGDAKCQNLRVIRVRIHLVTSASSKPAAAATTLCAPVTRIRTIVLARTPAQVTPILDIIVFFVIIIELCAYNTVNTGEFQTSSSQVRRYALKAKTHFQQVSEYHSVTFSTEGLVQQRPVCDKAHFGRLLTKFR